MWRLGEIGYVSGSSTQPTTVTDSAWISTVWPLPWDAATVVASVKKTGRCVVSHEAPRTCGFGAEVAAEVQERAFLHLEAPVARVTGFDTPFSCVHEASYLPDVNRVFEAIKRTIHY